MIVARTDAMCSVQSHSLDARMRPSKISIMYDIQNVERLQLPDLRNWM